VVSGKEGRKGILKVMLNKLKSDKANKRSAKDNKRILRLLNDVKSDAPQKGNRVVNGECDLDMLLRYIKSSDDLELHKGYKYIDIIQETGAETFNIRPTPKLKDRINGQLLSITLQGSCEDKKINIENDFVEIELFFPDIHGESIKLMRIQDFHLEKGEKYIINVIKSNSKINDYAKEGSYHYTIMKLG
jgi:hypothetical protein